MARTLLTENFGADGSPWPDGWTIRFPEISSGQENGGAHLVTEAWPYSYVRADYTDLPDLADTEVSGTVVSDSFGEVVEQYVAVGIDGTPGTDGAYGVYAPNGSYVFWFNYALGNTPAGVQFYQENGSVEDLIAGGDWPGVLVGDNLDAPKVGFRFQRVGRQLNGRVWDVRTPEPTDWQLSYTIPDETLRTGIVSLGIGNGQDAVPRGFTFDDVQIQDLRAPLAYLGSRPIIAAYRGTTQLAQLKKGG
jgi:hypothetical protein